MEHADTPLDVASVVKRFWEAPDQALFTQKELALVAYVSEAYLERLRWSGGGPKYLKLGGGRLVRYTKGNSVSWINGSPPVASTSELPQPVVGPPRAPRKKREPPRGDAKQKATKLKRRVVSGVTAPPPEG